MSIPVERLRLRNVHVDSGRAAHRSAAQIARAWLARNVRQLGLGGRAGPRRRERWIERELPATRVTVAGPEPAVAVVTGAGPRAPRGRFECIGTARTFRRGHALLRNLCQGFLPRPAARPPRRRLATAWPVLTASS